MWYHQNDNFNFLNKNWDMEVMKTKNIELYSFDIFDTLVTRKTATPKGIFALMQKELKDNSDFSKELRENFYSIRIESECNARERCKNQINCTEITFDDIYNEMQLAYGLSDDLKEYLKSLEIKTESENLVSISENLNRLKDLISRNKRVILVSDMYYSSETLHRLLSNIDKVFDNIKIYVSSEQKASKSEGSLYKLVQKEEKVRFKSWEHYGDNKNADIKNAKKQGINAVWYDFKQLMPYEKVLLKKYPSSVDIQLMVGTAKLTRLNKQDKNQDKYDFGASFSAPILYNYVTDVIETALKNGYKTLYFIARDGYIPMVIADIIIKKRNLPIKTKYLYGSRLTWRIPDEESYEYFIETNLKEYKLKLTLEFLSYRLGISLDTFSKFFPSIKTNVILKEEQILKVKSFLLQNNKLKQEILNAFNNKRELLIEYLRQEVDFSEQTLAFVEVNGSGRTQLFLSNYLNKVNPCSTYNFFITLSPDCVKNIIQLHPYFTKKQSYNTVLELLCRTTYGQAIGYKKENDRIVSILDEFNASAIIEWGYEEYIKGIQDYVNKLLCYKRSISNKELFYTYFEYLKSSCDKNIASIVGDIPFLRIGKENIIQKASPQLSIIDLFINFINKEHIEKKSQYPFLSYARGSWLFKEIKYFRRHFKFINKFKAELKLYCLLRKLKNEKIVLWGASIFLEDFIKRWNITFDNIVGVIDNNPKRQGQSLGIYPIISVQDIFKYRPQYMIMTIWNWHRENYEDISEVMQNTYNFVKLLPDFFDMTVKDVLMYKYNKPCTTDELQQRLINMENNLNRLIQTNISTAKLHQNTFMPFKNKHNGQDVVIVATGPSAERYQPIENAIHIGVNRAFQMGNYRIPLDYVFIHDFYGVTPEYIDDLDSYRPNECQKFYGLMTEWCYKPECTLPESHAIKANALRYRTDWIQSEGYQCEFAYDISTRPLGNFNSVTFAALQFALWTNPKRIYLVGCDCTTTGYAYDTKAKNFLVPADLFESYKKFKDFAHKYYPETEIISINPVGLKGIFKDEYQ